ncbi:alcohol dehydrogenase [Sulfoacidibacillus thermotolerans]|uniref:Alcohol dehydrogenase n=2 Tax=Sulfoacidibacillus thermotolerans TaxID=1765684 RepID=A0A2U3DCH7_SULT2|nr:alcohol dehydrogenase [Sulfoacidibacillus thermotolerans]
MRAAVFVGVNQPLQIEELLIPEPKDGEVLIRVAACGVCHTDLHVMQGDVKFPTPAVLGHEISGTVAKLGPCVEGLSIGQRVVSAFIMPCGTCQYCQMGRDDLCEKFFSYNRLKGQLYDGETRLFRPDGSPVWMYSMGGLAEYAVVPATDVFVLPDEIALDTAAILGCAVFTAYGAVRHASAIQAGDTVAVVAAGGIGLNAIQWAKTFGAAQIVAIDLDENKLQLARQMGATQTVEIASDPVTTVKALTGGKGVDIAIEALGSAQTFSLAADLVRDGGRITVVGIAKTGVSTDIELQRVVRRSLQIVGSYGARTRTDMPEILQFAATGKINYEQSITATYSLEQADEAYVALRNRQINGRAIVRVEKQEEGRPLDND